LLPGIETILTLITIEVLQNPKKIGKFLSGFFEIVNNPNHSYVSKRNKGVQ